MKKLTLTEYRKEFSNIRDMKALLHDHGIACPETEAEQPGTVKRCVGSTYGFKFGNLHFECYDPQKAEHAVFHQEKFASFDDLLDYLGGSEHVRVINATLRTVPAMYSFSHASGHLHVAFGSHILADLGKFDELVELTE